MAELASEARPFRVAIIGSGPSGFYAAEELFANPSLKIKVDMFDRLPAPFGLVRYGVAPDHPKIKNVIKIYEKTASNPNFGFLGNVTVGKDISVEELRNFYDAIIFACGAQTDRRLGIPGEDLHGSYTATEFVAWYNGHPEYKDRQFDLSNEVAVVIGQGNVAMDVSRILCKTVDELKETDIAQHALELLSKSKIKEVHLIGRRGPVQAAFTPPEAKEFGELKECEPIVHPEDLDLNEASKAELEDSGSPTRKKNYEILNEYSRRAPSPKPRRLVFHFCKSPKELQGTGKIEKLILEKNTLFGPVNQQQAVGTGKLEELKCGIVFRSVGYRGVSIPGVPFDEKKGIFPNVEGRLTLNGQTVTGLYAVGWIKRGPSGVIGTNKPDSVATVKKVLEDVSTLPAVSKTDSNAVLELLKNKGVKVVRFEDWKKIDAEEMARGKAIGKPREKFIRVDEMLKLI